MDVLGKHLLAEFYDCDVTILDSISQIESIMIEAVNVAGATIVQPVFHKFAPQGVSGVVVIAESHFAIHTWPEHAYASVDLYSCGEIDQMAALRFMKDKFKCKKYQVSSIERGILPQEGKMEKLKIKSEIV